MAQINNLTAVDSLASGDHFVIYDTSNGDARRVSASALLTFLQANLTLGMPQFKAQYSAPSATGFSVTIAPPVAGDNVHLILTPVAGYANGTVVLPAVAGLIDKQEILVNCTQIVTTLAITANGATAVNGEPTSLGADDFFRMKYDAITSSWYRVG